MNRAAMNPTERTEKIAALAAMIETQYREQFEKQYATLKEVATEYYLAATVVEVKPGKTYTKVNVGGSGKYMVDEAGNVWGIKGYGQVHKGHWYGTLDTIQNYDWSGYTARYIV